MSDFLLDTAVVIRCLRGVPDSLELMGNLTEEGDLHISVWSHFETLILAHPREEKRTLEFLTPFIVHPINEGIAQRAAALVRYHATSAPLNFAQAIIAATSLQHNLTLVTYRPENLTTIAELKLYPVSTVPA